MHAVCTNDRCRAERSALERSASEQRCSGGGGGGGSSSINAMEHQTYMPIGWCGGCYCWRTKCFRRYDWACPDCGNHNYARKQALRAKHKPTL